MDDEKKTQSQWGQQQGSQFGWNPSDYAPEPSSDASSSEPPAQPQPAAGAADQQQPQQPANPWQQPAQPWTPPAPQPTTPPWQPAPGWQPTGWQPQPPQQTWTPPAPQPNQPWQPPAQPWAQPAPRPSMPTGFASPAGPARKSRLPQAILVAAACLIAFSAGMVTDRTVFGPTTVVAAPTASPQVDNAPLKDFQLYEQALQIVRQNFVGKSDLTDQQLLYGSIRGMVDALGDTGHTVFLTPTEYQASQSQLSGSIAGIGVLLATDNGTFTITKVLAGSPAEKGGVKAGDQITAVDGVSVAGLSFDVFASKIRGQAGTKVTITVVRPGVAEPINITMTREVVDVPLVSWGMVPGTKIADIALVEFSSGASDQLATAISDATDSGAKGLILDLRGNPGGYAAEAVDVASQFIATGTVYITEDATGNREDNDVNTSIAHTSLPLVVLVDHNSASAAEIVAGALQDSKRAKIVGESTYGTGTVLQAFKLDDGSAILLGTAYWLTPDGNKIFGKGITPDQLSALAAGVEPLDPSNLHSMTTAQYNASGDAQLIAGVKLLTSGK